MQCESIEMVDVTSVCGISSMNCLTSKNIIQILVSLVGVGRRQRKLWIWLHLPQEVDQVHGQIANPEHDHYGHEHLCGLPPRL